MELTDLVKDTNIVGVISSFKEDIDNFENVADLHIKKLEQAFLMVNLKNDIRDKKISDLTDAEKWKLDLARKLNDDIIVVGNLSGSLNNKEIDYFKKLFIKLKDEYHKKIIIIDKDIEIFFNLTNNLVVLKDNKVIYKTNNYFDNELYKYAMIPKIIEFIKYVNKDKLVLNENTDIYELIKDIYRSVS